MYGTGMEMKLHLSNWTVKMLHQLLWALPASWSPSPRNDYQIAVERREFDKQCWTGAVWKKWPAEPTGPLITLLVFFRRSYAQSFVETIIRRGRTIEKFANCLVRLYFGAKGKKLISDFAFALVMFVFKFH